MPKSRAWRADGPRARSGRLSSELHVFYLILSLHKQAVIIINVGLVLFNYFVSIEFVYFDNASAKF